MKNIKGKTLLFVATGLVGILASCGGGNDPIVSVDPIIQPTIDVTSKVGYDAGRDVMRKIKILDKAWIEEAHTGFGESTCPNKGRSKLLVVPVLYSDNTLEGEELQTRKECVQKVFYGEASDTTWQSVRSYYYQSSFHQLYFDGEVANPVTLTETYSDLASTKDAYIYNTVSEEIYDLLFGTGCQYEGKESNFDNDGDGIIDGCYFVPLDSPIDSSVTMGWAFSTKHFYASARQAKKFPQYKKLGPYAWTSIKFSQNTASDRPTWVKPDAHTFIHEMGHVLGLKDYYDPNNQGGAKAGCSTMQDHNVCDHDIYSKYLWGWVSPKAVTDANTEETIDITIKPSQTNGDCIVLTSGWNGTAYDEYLILEYYTPTGLQEHDVKTSYGGNTQGVNDSGIRVWHVDKNVHEAHLETVTGTGLVTYFDPFPASVIHTSGDPDYNIDPDDAIPEDNDKQTSDPSTNENDTYYTTFTTNNSSDYDTVAEELSNFYIKPELQVIRAHGGSTEELVADDLFKVGDKFDISEGTFKDFEFYTPAEAVGYNVSESEWAAAKKATVPYNFTVTAISEESATIRFTKVK